MAIPNESRIRTVTSKQNSLVKDLRKAFSQSEPTEEGYIAIEGMRVVEEAIRSGLRFQALFLSVSGIAHGSRLVPQMADHVEILMLPDEVFASAVATETPQGVAALVKLKSFELKSLLDDPAKEILVLGVAGVQDPGNLGTIIRSAEAFGARAVILGQKTVSHLNSKAIRASAGSIFRQPVIHAPLLSEAIRLLKAYDFFVIGASSHKGKPLHEADLTGRAALLIGNEGAGLPPDVLAETNELVSIPHSAKVESLNAGVAASILLYEAARQRQGV
jgi:TrmH family RNA methyltransferase